MSSKIPHGLREQRGNPQYITDLPDNIQSILKSLHSTCGGPIGLYGSYAKGTRAEDSDLDIGVVNCRIYTKIIKNIANHYNTRIDCNEYNKDYHLTIIQ